MKKFLFAVIVALVSILNFSLVAFAADEKLAGEADASVVSYVMPTVDSLEDQDYNYLVSGTDQYNEQLAKIGQEYNIDPVFLKTIMSIESCGVIDAKNGSFYGLFQIGKSFGFDNDKMLTDSEYAIRCACEVILSKVAECDRIGVDHSVYYVAKFYNGSGSYGKFAGYLYSCLGDGTKNSSVFIEE